jgi:outer membrane protein assembly factor BamB
MFRIAVKSLITLLIIISFSQAKENGAYNLQKAIYLFELKGDYKEAIRILNELSIGETPESAKASLYLGKIYELQGIPGKASVYYAKVLQSDDIEYNEKIWVAGRLKKINPEPIRLVQNIFKTKLPIKQIFGNSSQYIILNDDRMYKHSKSNLSPIYNLNEKNPLYADNNELIVSNSDNSLEIIELNYPDVSKTISLETKPLSIFPFRNDEKILITEKSIELLKFGKSIAKKENKWKNCSPIGELRASQDFLMLCPDNAIHFIRFDRNQNKNVSVLEDIKDVQISPESIYITTPNIIYCFRPHISLSPIWKYNISNITRTALYQNRLFVQTNEGLTTLLSTSDGKESWRKHTGSGYILPLEDRFAIVSNQGLTSVFNNKGELLWNWNAGISLSTKPFHYEGSLFIPTIQNLVYVLDKNFLGIQPSHIDTWEELLEQSKALNNWTLSIAIADSLLTYEPGNYRAWSIKSGYFLQNPDSFPKDSLVNAIFRSILYGGDFPKELEANLKTYAEITNMTWVSRTSLTGSGFPVFFGNQNELFFVDRFKQTLYAWSPQTGKILWNSATDLIESPGVFDYQDQYLVVSDNFKIRLMSLKEKGKVLGSIELPGKVRKVSISGAFLVISTWNGYLMKFTLKDLQPVWSRKYFNTASWFEIGNKMDMIYCISLNGELKKIQMKDGQIINEYRHPDGIISDFLLQDSLLVISDTQQKISVLTSNKLEVIWGRTVASQVFSAQTTKKQLILGLSDQSIQSLDLHTGNSNWAWQGQNSIINLPALGKKHLYSDQGNAFVQLSLESGKVLNTYRIPEKIGPVYNSGGRFFAGSENGLIYALPGE